MACLGGDGGKVGDDGAARQQRPAGATEAPSQAPIVCHKLWSRPARRPGVPGGRSGPERGRLAKTAIYHHPACARHDTGWRHPEHQGRLRAVTGALERATPVLATGAEHVLGVPLDPARLELVHTAEHIATVQRAAAAARAERRLVSLDADTVLSGASWEAATAAAGCVVGAVEAVSQGTYANAFCAVRPPGHHATGSRAMGFCLVNSVAVGARHAVEEGLASRVLIVDWDVHHGNGTQDIFYRDPDVFYLSMHQSPFYPGSGARTERGEGPGDGTTLNVPLPPGMARQRYVEELLAAIEHAASFEPELVLISAGFDAAAEDPIGGFTLREEDFQALTAGLERLTRSSAAGRIVSALEGGYNPEELGRNVVAHIEELMRVRASDAHRSNGEEAGS